MNFSVNCFDDFHQLFRANTIDVPVIIYYLDINSLSKIFLNIDKNPYSSHTMIGMLYKSLFQIYFFLFHGVKIPLITQDSIRNYLCIQLTYKICGSILQKMKRLIDSEFHFRNSRFYRPWFAVGRFNCRYNYITFSPIKEIRLLSLEIKYHVYHFEFCIETITNPRKS